LVGQRTGIINQNRAFLLERGVPVRQGLRFLRAELPGILAKGTDVLSPRMLHVIEGQADDWHRLDDRIEALSSEIGALACGDPACDRLMTVPGIGPIISSAMVAAIGNGAAFSKGRDFGAWLGLVPKQISTGDRTILGKISRRGNRYLRVLFVQAAWVVLIRPKSWERERREQLARHSRILRAGSSARPHGHAFLTPVPEPRRRPPQLVASSFRRKERTYASNDWRHCSFGCRIDLVSGGRPIRDVLCSGGGYCRGRGS
jgi:transposase